MGGRLDQQPDPRSIQAVVDALSIGLKRPILFDDAALVPVAYSRQWDVDEVRSSSILSRGPAPAVREALLAQRIDAARDVIHTDADPDLGMASRVCLPVRDGSEVLGYLWLLDPDDDLTEEDLERLRGAARELAAILLGASRREVPDEADLFDLLRSPDPERREGAAAVARERHLLSDGGVILCLLAAHGPGADPVGAARQAVRRLSVGHAIAATAAEGAALLASLGDPVLRTLPHAELATWVRAVAAADVAVGQSGEVRLSGLDEGARQAALALRVARRRGAEEAIAAFPTLGADRLVAQLPETAIRDIPPGLASLLREEPVLVATLAAFLDAGGDVKATAAALSLHRSGLYYRLRRIQELTGLDLDRGDDRLLAHLAIRAEQMF
ncbi:MAG TPA: helix-turn-helix domain-containing protein [Solirubrobacterales bacterium]|nr:helix-turn-helix domain-containing protein [Solirubrobacterales bacterium]